MPKQLSDNLECSLVKCSVYHGTKRMPDDPGICCTNYMSAMYRKILNSKPTLWMFYRVNLELCIHYIFATHVINNSMYITCTLTPFHLWGTYDLNTLNIIHQIKKNTVFPLLSAPSPFYLKGQASIPYFLAFWTFPNYLRKYKCFLTLTCGTITDHILIEF